MRMTIDIDCTPAEARTLFGMPDVEAVNQMIVAEVIKRAKDNMDTLADPEKFVAQMMSMGGKGMGGLQTVMAAAMGGGKK